MKIPQIKGFKYWIVAILIIGGISARLKLVTGNKYSSWSTYSTQIKANLNFSWYEKEMVWYANKWRSSEDLKQRLFTTDRKTPDWKELKSQLKRSNHPPLYYYLVHVVTVFTNGEEASLMKGLLLNVFFSLMSMFVFYKILKELFAKQSVRNLGLLFFSCSIATMNTVFSQKAYELQILLILSVVLVFIIQTKEKKARVKWYVLITGLTTAALLSHYFSYILIAFLGIAIAIYHLFLDKKYSRVLHYFFAISIATMLAIWIYPQTINDLFGDHRSVEIQEKLWETKLGISNLRVVFKELSSVYTLPVSFLFGFAFASILINRKLKKNIRLNRSEDRLILLLSIFGLVGFIVLMFLSPINNLRYASPVIPILFLPLLQTVSWYKKHLNIIALGFGLWFLSSTVPKFNKWIKGKEINYTHEYRPTNTLRNLDGNRPVMLVTDVIEEQLRPILYNISEREIAISAGEINWRVLEQKPNALVYFILAPRTGQRGKRFRRKTFNELKKRNYKLMPEEEFRPNWSWGRFEKQPESRKLSTSSP